MCSNEHSSKKPSTPESGDQEHEPELSLLATDSAAEATARGSAQFCKEHAALIAELQEQRQRTESLAQQLRQERDLLATIMENTRAQLAYLDADFRFVHVNSTYAKGSGYREDELIGRNHFHLFPNDENEAIFRQVRDTGEPVSFRARPFVFPSRPELGTTYWDWTLTPIKNADGTVEGLVLSLMDVTEQQQAMQALHRREEAFRALGENAQDIIARFDATLRCTYANPAMERLIDSIGKSVSASLAHQDVADSDRGCDETNYDALLTICCPAWREQIRQVLTSRTEQIMSCILPTPQGDRHFDIRYSPEFALDGSVASVLAIGRDVTAHKEAERKLATLNTTLEEQILERTRELAASEMRFRIIFEEAGIGMALLDREGCVIASNRALQQMLGYPAKISDAASNTTLDPAQHRLTDTCLPRDRHRIERALEEMQQGRRRLFHREQRYITPQGKMGWANLTLSVIRTRRDEQTLAIAMIEDITERREAQQALIHAERLNAVGELAASLTHEINNPLQAATGCLQLVAETLAPDDDNLRYLEIANEELRRAARLVQQLRDLNRPGESSARQCTDLVEMVEDVLHLNLHECQKRHIRVKTEAAQNISIPIVPDQIRQVLLNLVMNAIDAMPNGGELHISVRGTEEPRQGAAIAVRDTGDGIPPEVMEHLFELFYTTKENGVGLGLHISQQIVQQHDGTIEVHSEPGQGTEFSIWLPAKDPQ
jgi:PAS domain S-box-containing protein